MALMTTEETALQLPRYTDCLVSDQWESKQTDIKVNLFRCLFHSNTIINQEGRVECLL